MKLYGYTCEQCNEWHRRIRGAPKSDSSLTVKCQRCGAIEQVREPTVKLA
jgi:transcription elongation factor Elf1